MSLYIWKHFIFSWGKKIDNGSALDTSYLFQAPKIRAKLNILPTALSSSKLDFDPSSTGKDHHYAFPQYFLVTTYIVICEAASNCNNMVSPKN